jgi:hypothetical protein
MKTLVIGFSRPIKPTLFSRLIQFADKQSNFDHVYATWNWPMIDREIIYQASKLSVNFESNVTFDGHAIRVEEYEVSVNDEPYKEIMQFCMDNSNKPYGIKEVFGFAYVKICALFKLKVNNPFPTYGSSFVCSKLITEILQIAQIVDPRISPDNVDPLDLNTIIKASGLKNRLT